MAGMGRRIWLAAKVEARRPASIVAAAAGVATGVATFAWPAGTVTVETSGSIIHGHDGMLVLVGSWLAAAAVGELPEGWLIPCTGRNSVYGQGCAGVCRRRVSHVPR